MQNLITIALVIAAAYWFWPREEVWLGFVYPDRGNLIAFENIGEFQSLQDCLDGIYARIRQLDDPSAADFECGLNCRPYSAGSDLQICEETRDSI